MLDKAMLSVWPGGWVDLIECTAECVLGVHIQYACALHVSECVVEWDRGRGFAVLCSGL